MLVSNVSLFRTTTSKLASQLKAPFHLTSSHSAAKKSYQLKFAFGKEPLYQLDKYIEAEENGQLESLAYEKIRFARTWETDSLFMDDYVERYTRRMMIDGRKGLMYRIMNDALYEMKCIQYKKWRKLKEKQSKKKSEDDSASGVQGEEDIEVDPVVIFRRAIDNCKPQVITRKVKRGGATYNVPYPITDMESEWTAMHWINQNLKDRPKPRDKHYHEVLAREILEASMNRGQIIKIRDDTHRLAQANKAYSHYRWG